MPKYTVITTYEVRCFNTFDAATEEEAYALDDQVDGEDSEDIEWNWDRRGMGAVYDDEGEELLYEGDG